MKDGVRQVIGKTISSVVVGKSKHDPQVQVFLVFDDGTYFEFWGAHFRGAGRVDRGGVQEASAYIEKLGGEVTAVYSE
jgi:hypothetical protein